VRTATVSRGTEDPGHDGWEAVGSPGKPGGPFTHEEHMSWMQTYTGKRFSLPVTPDMFALADIAHALAYTCRYGGHSPRFYSVAEHSILLAKHAMSVGREDLARVALMHDAAEAYIGDMPRPLKVQLKEFVALERHVEQAIEQWLGWSIHDPTVKEWDTAILGDERAALFPGSPDWNLPHEPLGVRVQFLYPACAEDAFWTTAELLGVDQVVSNG
jgi:hypothetical protein